MRGQRWSWLSRRAAAIIVGELILVNERESVYEALLHMRRKRVWTATHRGLTDVNAASPTLPRLD